MITPQIPKGFRDFLPEKMTVRQNVTGLMTAVFERFGFEPLDTPCLEYAETLEGKYGEEGEKLIYKFQDRGERMVALRYDLTIPLCRVIAMHPELVKPFKRYHIAPVWRADKPQKGRFREFYQCDIDIIGSPSIYADAELLVITHGVLQALGFSNFIMRINNRKLLNAIALKAGMHEQDIPDFLRSLDKLDKIGTEGVLDELRQKGLLQGSLETHLHAIIEAASASSGEMLGLLAGLVQGIPVGEEGIRELVMIQETLAAHEVPESCYRFDVTLARGLDYYTGPIFETIVTEPKIGSITGGGRYDNLIGLFTKQPVPATGTSFGLERIITVMEELGGGGTKAATTQVLVTFFDQTLLHKNMKIAKTLRDAGISTELYFTADKLKKQLAYAANRAIPRVVILGSDEDRDGRITLRNMQDGSQEIIPQSGLVAAVKKSFDVP